ncbi:hypothetical protein HMSSN036_66110 [Paenibacillus macerans]|nr:hypothetical protein HMSSN036_66110 [Paenibacillus macerans]
MESTRNNTKQHLKVRYCVDNKKHGDTIESLNHIVQLGRGKNLAPLGYRNAAYRNVDVKNVSYRNADDRTMAYRTTT